MNNKIIIGIIAIIAVIGGIYFFAQKQPTTNQQVTVETNTITIKNFSFSPDTLTVKQGTKITWINEDSVTHTIKSDTFNSSDISSGNKFEFTFNNKGRFDYSCGIHPSMKGEVIVK